MRAAAQWILGCVVLFQPQPSSAPLSGKIGAGAIFASPKNVARYPSHATAYRLWFALKLILGAGLIYLWRKYLCPDEDGFIYALFLLLAFGATFYIDLLTGNVTLSEQALSWLGFLLLPRGRPLGFCVTLLLWSAFKLTRIVFVALLPLLNVRNAWKYPAGTAAVGIGLTGLSYILNPAAWNTFISRGSAADEAGHLGNPSTLSMFRDIVSISDKWAGTLPDAIPMAFHAICVVRFKTYSFILLLPPALHILRHSANLSAFGFFLRHPCPDRLNPVSRESVPSHVLDVLPAVARFSDLGADSALDLVSSLAGIQEQHYHPVHWRTQIPP